MNSRFIELLHQRTLWLVIALLVWVSFFGQGFWTLANLQNLVVALSVDGIMVMGMTIVMIGGGFDLSIGSVVALSGVTVVQALPLGKPVAIVLALIAASMVGLANGMLISGLRVNPFIATLSTMVVVRGLVMTYTNGQPLPGVDPIFMSLGRATVFGDFPLPGLIFGVTFALTHLLLTSLKIGREVYALGGSEESARSSGIATYRVKMFSYMICSFTAGISGIVLAARLNTGSPVIGENTALNVITAVLLGGASLSGGVGSALGSFGGLLCISLLGNGLNLFDVPAYYQRIAQGLLLLVLVVLERIAHRAPAAFAYRAEPSGDNVRSIDAGESAKGRDNR
jgi:ribose/xylose/arabinose/galactoside ABC-type transport system permease subunit